MFTGIIQSVGTVESLNGENLVISPDSDKFQISSYFYR